AAIVSMISSSAYAQTQTTIKTDQSWGRTLRSLPPSAATMMVVGNRGTNYNIAGNVYIIPQAIGKVAGANLFHSFESLSIGSGDAAVVTTTSIRPNVITRGSGSSPTVINGLLALRPAAGSNPNFFLINPNGVTFTGAA